MRHRAACTASASSVVNALSDELTVEVARDKKLWRQTYSRGKPTSKLKQIGRVPNRRGTAVSFHPDPEIFGKTATFMRPTRLFRMSRSKAYLLPRRRDPLDLRPAADHRQGRDADRGSLSFPRRSGRFS